MAPDAAACCGEPQPMNALTPLLEITGRRRTPFIQQSEASECALACLAMIASHHGYKTDLGSLRQKHTLSLKGATLKQVIEVAEAIGFSARPLRGEPDDLINLNLPAILHWDMNHFVVLTKIENTLKGVKYHIHDPARSVVALNSRELSQHFSGVALELIRSESFRPKLEQVKFGITQLWTSMHGFWPAVRSIVILSLILQLALLAAPFYLQIAIDTVAPAADRDLLLMLALGFGGLTLINLAAGWLRSLMLVSLNQSLSYQVIVNLFRHLSRLPLPWFEKRHVGDIISRFGSTQPITQLLSEGMISSFIDGLMALLTLGLMFIYSPMLAGVALAAFIIYGALRWAFLHSMRLRNVDLITTMARENSLFIESVRGIAAIKAFGQEGNRQRLWQQSKADAVNANIKLGRMNSGFDASGQFILGVERVVFVYLAISLALDGVLTVGMIFAFQAYKQHFLDAGMRLIEQSINLSIMKVHLSRLSDIALSAPEDEGRSLGGQSPQFSDGMRVQNVRFRYGVGEPEILQGVSFEVQPGEMISLVGPSGGGKTTLLKIMMGLFEPTQGHVAIGNQPLTSFSKQRFRSRIGVVAQDDSLYAGTLAENISFFDPQLDMDRVIEVAKIAAIHDDIDRMPLRYDTLVGDMGSALSGGQKQRVLLARALYGKPDILFMDEGTANLDPACEQKVVAALLSLPITRVLVAHRPALVHASHRVFLCAGGNLQPLKMPKPTSSEAADDLYNS